MHKNDQALNCNYWMLKLKYLDNKPEKNLSNSVNQFKDKYKYSKLRLSPLLYKWYVIF